MSAALKLELFQNGQLLQEIPVGSDASPKEVWVGRDEACVIQLDDRAISRKHAIFRSTQNGGIEFEKKSKFGWVKVNGEEQTQATLRDGDRLEMGSFEIRVKGEKKTPPASEPLRIQEEVNAPEPSPATDGDQPAEAGFLSLEQGSGSEENVSVPADEGPAANPFEFNDASPEGIEALNAESSSSQTNLDIGGVSNDGATRVIQVQNRVKAVLQFGDGAANVTQYEIADHEIAIGRSQQCHVVLEDKRSSRKHALIRREDQKYILKDLGSANGTLINQVRVDEQELQSGDQLQIGDTVFEFKVVQVDYEQKKGQFIQVPEPEIAAAAAMPTPLSLGHQDLGYQPQPMPMQEDSQAPAQEFQVSEEPKKSFIGKILDRYRAMTTKQQIIYGALVLGLIWMLLQDDTEKPKGSLVTGEKKVLQKKEVAKPIGGGTTFEMLTPEQQRYVATQYQLAFDYYKGREYDQSILAVTKIFSLVQDYKNAREIETFAREGKRKLEAQEEERKRKEDEKQAKLKLQALIEQAGMLMDKKRYKEAEALFPEIELNEPENLAVAAWRKQIMAEAERLDAEKAEMKRVEDEKKSQWSEYQKIVDLVKSKDYYDALDAFDDLLARPLQDPKLTKTIKDEIAQVEKTIADARDPFLADGRQLEKEGKLTGAYKAYQKAADADPVDDEGVQGMKRIRATLDSRAKPIYAEGVFAESFGDNESAEKKYKEILEIVPNDNDYYVKAQARLRKITVLKRASAGDAPQ